MTTFNSNNKKIISQNTYINAYRNSEYKDTILKKSTFIWFLTIMAFLKYQIHIFSNKITNLTLFKNFHIDPMYHLQKNYNIADWYKRLLYSQEEIAHVLNFPYMLSVLINDIKENLQKKTIYLYQTIIIITLPILILRVHKQFTYKKNLIVFQDFFYKKNGHVITKGSWLQKEKINCMQNEENKYNSKNNNDNTDITKKKENKYIFDILLYSNRKYQNIYVGQKELKKQNNEFFKTNYFDHKRLFENLKNKLLYKKYIHKNLTIQDEWNAQNTFLDGLFGFEFNSNNDEHVSEKYNNIFITKNKTNHNIHYKSFIKTLYIDFIQPKHLQIDFLENEKNLICRCFNIVPQIEQKSIKNKYDINLNFKGIKEWLSKYNISDKYIEKVNILEIIINYCLKKQNEFMKQFLSWLKNTKKNTKITHSLEIHQKHGYPKKEIKISIVNKNVQKLNYKIIEWLKQNTLTLNMFLKNKYYIFFYEYFSKKTYLINMLDLYWTYQHKILSKTINDCIHLCHIKNIYTEYSKNIFFNKIFRNQICWNSQTNDANKLKANIKNIKQKDLLIDIKNIVEPYDIVCMINEITKIHYFPYEKSKIPFLSISNKDILTNHRIFYHNILQNKQHDILFIKDINQDHSAYYNLFLNINKKISNHIVNKKQTNIEQLKEEIQYVYKNIIEKENIPTNIFFGETYTQQFRNYYQTQKQSSKQIQCKVSKNLSLKAYLMDILNIKRHSNIRDDMAFFINGSKNENTFYRNDTETKKFNQPIINQDENWPIGEDSQMLQQYNLWIFTSQWWELLQNITSKKVPILKQNFYDIKQSIYRPQIKNSLYTLNRQWKNITNKFLFNWKQLYYKTVNESNKFLLNELYISKTKYMSIWDVFYKSLNTAEWVTICWLLTICTLYYHWISILIGTQYVQMWYQFENMRFLSYPSSNTFLNILVYNSIESPSKNLRLSMYTSKGWVIWVKSIILGYLVKNKFIANNFFRTYGTDIQATKTNLVVHSLITRHQLVSKYNLWNFHKNTQNIKLKKNKPVYYEGIHFLQKWSRRYARCSQFLQSQPSGLNKLNSLNDFFFDMEYENQKRNLKKNNVFILQNRNKPRILSETITLTKRWLLIGTTDTGKSYIIKQLAAATYIPLVHISLKTIRHSTPDFKYNKLKKYNKWIKQLADRGLLLFNVLELAKILAPCIFWISDLHEFHATYSTKNKKEKIYDASLLLTILLKVMGNDLLPVKNSNITFIGSTNSPSLLDPKIVSQHRLDLIINLRKPSCYQRKQIFTNLLNEKGFSINTKNCFNEIGNQTIGHSIGDIATLVNETLLINIENSNASVTTDLIRLASDRQVSKHSANNKILETETIQYKIGKAIIQTILIPWKPLLSITKKHDLWKTRFYYLSNAFLEFSIEKSIVTELVILSYIINCLAGSAARDAWILYENNLTIHNISINKKLKHDLSIASNLLQSLLLDFPMQEIHFINSDIIKSSQTKNNFYYIKKNEYSLNFFQRFSSYIYWSYRIERLSLNWTLLFDHINQSKKEINKQLLSTTKKTDNSILLKEEISHKQLPYERRITKSQEKRAQKLNDTFDELMVDTTLKSMGFPWFSEYVMNYDALNLSILLLETRTIWNPPVITPSYSVLFFDRDLTINRNILTKIYITYGEKFKTEKLNPKRIKKQVFLSDDTVNNYNANQISNNSKINTITKTDNFHYYKQMVKSQANLEQLQLQPPVYLYQFWTFQDNIQNIDDANFINHRRNLKNQILQNQEILLYGILVEIYDWLVKFFIMNHNISHNIEEQLLANGILNREYIEKIIENTKLE